MLFHDIVGGGGRTRLTNAISDIQGGGGGRTRLTNTISDIQSLQSFVDKCDQISLLPNNHSFTFMFAVTHYTEEMK